MTTVTQIAACTRNAAREQADKDFQAVARAEFPIGRRVRWVHTYRGREGKPSYLEGTVAGYGFSGWRFEIKRDTGAVFDVEPERLEPVDEAPVVARPGAQS